MVPRVEDRAEIVKIAELLELIARAWPNLMQSYVVLTDPPWWQP
jgi:hypothetical protein